MYSWPSASHIREPSALRMKRGVPPTALKARTGEFTPPGIRRSARANSSSDWRHAVHRTKSFAW